MRERLVLVGNGMAGVRTLEELLKLAPDRYDITVFGAEPHPNYNRILLSPVLSGEKTPEEIVLNGRDWYESHGITLHTGAPVTTLDRARRRVVAADGTEAGYDRLLLATGSRPVRLPIPGSDLDGVVTFRDIADVESMVAASAKGRRAAVIGGGLLGLEAAHGLRERGMEVTVVHLADHLMERQLDAEAGGMLQQSMAERGIAFELSAKTEAVLGEEAVSGIRLADGRTLEADLVVMAAGIQPEKSLAEASGLHCERGVVVGDTMQTFDPRVYAVGECVQHRGATYGLVAPLFEQAKVAANHLAELGSGRYEGSVTSTKLKVSGIDLFSAGDFEGDEDTESMVLHDAASGIYKKLVVRDNRIEGAVLFGDTIDGSWYFELLRDGTDISDMRDQLLFGQAHVGDAGHGEGGRVAVMADETEICGCNGVCKGDITKAITEKGLFTLDEVRAHTKASASCGSCTGLVESLLAFTVGEGYDETPRKKAVCGCTDYSHDEVRAAIRDHALKSIPEVMHFLEWKNEDGCTKCRPALNYYLLCEWPGEYADDPASRFINERAHANIQKDGTYSVVPRIWGGVTSPAELRAIAEVAEKYEVPTVKFTGGQRIDLLGVTKEDLPHVWADLNAAGFVSGHAYGKAVRTVKTCVGQEWCRFGVQDSTNLGIELEHMAWGAWTPHKVKLAVSGCPRNCAESTIKDLGVVAVESGWELHVAGNGGTKVRAADFLTRVDTAEEVKEYTAAFLQLYREQAHYLERTAHWVERVGLAAVRERVVDDAETRRALADRFAHSQGYAQNDPWRAHAESGDQRSYIPIKEVTA
ncbi:nitrite reductase large subunit NirB [Thiohalorhabdus methylotrophus]|uniref:Nitrite reductase large subunit NirB n=1 Tax=Thiohalorhabdus methylotrophus TaxID=3242694 RepID=A0ABV4TTN1_9GAMM